MNFESFILIGGRSSRMGRDKFALLLGGQTFLEIAAETLKDFGRVSVVASAATEPARNGLNLIRDVYGNRGALSGIHAALDQAKSAFAVILACDYPFVTADLLSFLIDLAETEKDFHAFAPVQADGKIQPLCAVYRTDPCRQILTEMLDGSNEKFSVRDFLRRVKTRYVEFNEIAHLPNAENFFFNVNTSGDYEKAKILAAAVGITKMTVDELEEILRIQRESALEHWSREAYRSELDREDSFAVVAKVDDRTAGFLIGRSVAEERAAELYNIGVDLSFRRKKVGASLLLGFIEHCRKNDLERIFLEVRESNEAAIRFYLRNDFTVIGKRKNFYSNPAEDAILMERRIENSE